MTLTMNDISFSIPVRAGKIVSMCNYKDRILVACDNGLFELVDDGIAWSAYEKLVTRINELDKGK